MSEDTQSHTPTASPSAPDDMPDDNGANGSTDNNVAAPASGSKARQLLGMKGAQAGETSIWKIRLQLMKPITWIPLIWGVVCGAASSGKFVWSVETVLISAACMLMSGPLLTG